MIPTDRNFHWKFVLLYSILKRTDGCTDVQTRLKIVLTTDRNCGWASWFNYSLNHGKALNHCYKKKLTFITKGSKITAQLVFKKFGSVAN